MKRGDCFRNTETGEFYMLIMNAAIDAENGMEHMVCLVELQSGNRWADSVAVKTSQDITDAEFDKITDNQSDEFKPASRVDIFFEGEE